MGATHYYNEWDPYCAAWLRNLMDAGHIPAGDIDTRSIEDVRPDELAGYVQCHFFAGIGGWPLALALAGWPVDRPVWTGSCPCQPFSAAGKGLGFEDERHLWPAWQHLIAQCRPAVIFGEQVASKDADPWIDLVHADMEGMGHAFGCVPFPSAGVGAPHIRDRNYWVADLCSEGLAQRIGNGRVQRETMGSSSRKAPVCGSDVSRVAHSDSPERKARDVQPSCAGEGGQGRMDSVLRSTPDGLAHTHVVVGGQGRAIDRGWDSRSHARAWSGSGGDGVLVDEQPGPLHSFWADADWLLCTDGKWRPVEPGTFPLAHGIPNRVGRLRANGNAIVPQAAAEFIRAYAEARGLSVADPAEVVAA